MRYTPTHPTSEPRQQARTRLAGLAPRDVLVVSDMTNTLLHQSADGRGYPPLARRLHASFLQQGGALAVVTGDSLAVFQNEMLANLGALDRGTLVAITSAGARIDLVEGKTDRWSLQPLFCRAPLTAVVREGLFRRAQVCLEEVLDPACSAWLAVERNLLEDEGGRVDVAPLFAGLRGVSYLELSSNKLTIFFPAIARAEGLEARILDRLVADEGVRALADQAGLKIVRGPSYVDVISCDKREALESFFALPLACEQGLDQRQIVVLGDSCNDRGLFEYPYPAPSKTTRLFVGHDAPLVEAMRGALPRSPLIYLEGEQVAGSTFVFELLVNGRQT